MVYMTNKELKAIRTAVVEKMYRMGIDNLNVHKKPKDFGTGPTFDPDKIAEGDTGF